MTVALWMATTKNPMLIIIVFMQMEREKLDFLLFGANALYFSNEIF